MTFSYRQREKAVLWMLFIGSLFLLLAGLALYSESLRTMKQFEHAAQNVQDSNAAMIGEMIAVRSVCNVLVEDEYLHMDMANDHSDL